LLSLVSRDVRHDRAERDRIRLRVHRRAAVREGCRGAASVLVSRLSGRRSPWRRVAAGGRTPAPLLPASRARFSARLRTSAGRGASARYARGGRARGGHERVGGAGRRAAAELDAFNRFDSSSLVECMPQVGRRPFFCAPAQPDAIIDIPSDTGAYLACRKRKARRNLRNKLRKFTREPTLRIELIACYDGARLIGYLVCVLSANRCVSFRIGLDYDVAGRHSPSLILSAAATRRSPRPSGPAYRTCCG
jgi:hypothetical protein